eukprot:evm.model.scf_960EXC.1 EVM.evm.TU.scf_960EXC.1   scf_960EXC:8243-11958(+)
MAPPCSLLALSILLAAWGPLLQPASAQPILEEIKSQAFVDAAPVVPPPMIQGGAWIDVDGDGDLDFVLPGDPAKGVHLQWVENIDGQTFQTAALDLMVEDLPGPSKLGDRPQVLAADLNNDGLTDLYISGCMNPLPLTTLTIVEEDFEPGECSTAILFENLGGGKFRAHEDNGIQPALIGTGTAAGDANNDGLLDLYISDARLIAVTENPSDTYGNKLYINKGNFRFEDSGLSVDNPWSCVSAFVDFDYDGDQDIVTGACQRTTVVGGPNSTLPSKTPQLAPIPTPLLLLKNTLKENGTLGFEDVTEELFGKVYDGLWMSVVLGDINYDGRVDFYIGNWGLEGDPTGRSIPQPHLLMVSQPGGTWADEAAERGVADHAFNWGGAFIDLNNDGHLDLVTVGSAVLPTSVLSNNGTVFINDGTGNFSRAPDLGVAEIVNGGISAGDFNGDGSQDIMVVGQARNPLIPEGLFNDTGRLTLFKGTAPGERHVAFVLEGVESNRAGIGAFATVCPSADVFGPPSSPDVLCQHRVLTAGSGAYSTHSPVFHFGVPSGMDAVDVTLVWPSGAEDVHPGVEVGYRYMLKEGGEMARA